MTTESAMTDRTRRNILTTGAAAAATAATSRVLAQQNREGAAMSFYEKGPVRIHFEEKGSGFPLLMIAGGGLNSAIPNLSAPYSPFNATDEFKEEYRCVGADLRNANGGQSTGPLEIDRPWGSHTDDHLGLMDHLRIDKFMVLGFCIGGPMIWNLLKRAPDRIVAAVLAQPSGSRPVTRDFVRNCTTPVLILPDDVPSHPYAVAMEAAMLAPNAEVSMFPWKEPKERIPLAVRQIRSFLRAHRPASA